MQHKCKVTVIDKKVYPELQQKYIADPNAGACPFYKVGQEFIFERYGNEDTFWTMGRGSQCAEAWDCISRYIYTALQGGAIMRGWTNDDRSPAATTALVRLFSRLSVSTIRRFTSTKNSAVMREHHS